MLRLLTLLLLLPLAALAEVTTLSLSHRNAESLIPLLQPVVDEGVRISGRGELLIVNANPEQLEAIRQLVSQLDTPLQSLLISVIQGDESTRSGLHGEVSGKLSQPRLRIYGTDKRAAERTSQQLRVIEGGWALISSGEAMPIVTQSSSRSHHTTTTRQSIEYRDVQSGFEVSPTLHGDIVTLQLRPFRAKRATAGGGIIEQQVIVTTVSGKLGEWIELGGVAEQQQGADVGTIHATGKRDSTTHNVRVKVERLPNQP